MPTELRAGNSLHDLSADDIRAILAEQHARELAQAGNVKRMEFAAPIQPAAATVFLSQTTLVGMPDEGYVWSLKLCAVNLAAAGTLSVYKASSSGVTTRPLASFQQGTANLPLIATWSSDQAELKHGEGLYLVASQNITQVYVTGEQVTAEKARQIYD